MLGQDSQGSVFARDGDEPWGSSGGKRWQQKAPLWFSEGGLSRLLATRQRHHDLVKAEKKQLWVLMKCRQPHWTGGLDGAAGRRA